MRQITAEKIHNTVRDLSIRANLNLREDVLRALKRAHSIEKNKKAKNILEAIIDNAHLARKEKLPLCQDTGMPTVFVEIGREARILGGLRSAINRGIEAGYKSGYLRSSVIRNPLARGKPGYSPAVIHTDIVRGKNLKITVLPKGFGCENKAQLKMFNPTAKISEIKRFIIEAVKSAGPDACPPYIVGVGIGGTADYAMFLAKRSLLKNIVHRPSSIIHRLGEELLKEINALSIGPMGLGGRTTALAVNIETYPTHIAGLPVAVNICCHALRSAAKII